MQKEIAASPTFREESSDALLDSPQKISSAGSVVDAKTLQDDDEDESSELEFTFAVRDPDAGPAITADEIFSGGRIRPFYPLFDRDLLLAGDDGGHAAEEMAERLPLRRLLMEEREAATAALMRSESASSSSEADDLNGIPLESYCVWAPPTDRSCRKSRSTGSSLRWRLRDLVIGRSHSDGKDKFIFLATDNNKTAKSKSIDADSADGGDKKAAPTKELKKSSSKKEKTKGKKEIDMVTTHKLFYSGGAAVGGGSGKDSRPYMPYRTDLFGFLANVNGVNRSHHTF